MDAFNECLINTISVLLQPGEIPNLRRFTRICCEFRFLLTPVSGDTRLNQRGAQTQQGSAGRGAQPHPGGLCHTSGPSISSQHQKSVFPYPLGKHTSFFTLLCFPFLRGGSPNAPRHVPAARPCLVPSRGAVGGSVLRQEGTGCPTGLISCLQGNGSFLRLLPGMQNSSHSRLG